ncbi:hypothetical protein K470DRAFT_221708 [Piedraia hortae CBS 480.64]|uniref:Mitochondrial outer membrane protein n=1 Tax=Piedraia hortae CBS 480.64 TaxID=1314780 RepID=A0A6A7BSI3_9PEZI|nr:hypothetical protein K470DRAFT_221708 [Piedraia hortae CBS 480.64]
MTQPLETRQSTGIWSTPAPLKRLFDQLPLATYPANSLPTRAPRDRGQSVLHVFTTDDDARDGRPSFNPACLKWQTYLKFAQVEFRTVASSNHASPSGSLPFLLPSAGSEWQDAVVAGNKMHKWTGLDRERGSSHATHSSLIDNWLRKAWLFQLYLKPGNAAVCHRLYVAPCSSNPLVQLAIAHNLRNAAEAELINSCASHTLAEEELMQDADEAFNSLETLLGQQKYFSGTDTPDLMDASVFAYTHLLRSNAMQWQDNILGDMLTRYPGLVRHQERVMSEYFQCQRGPTPITWSCF